MGRMPFGECWNCVSFTYIIPNSTKNGMKMIFGKDKCSADYLSSDTVAHVYLIQYIYFVVSQWSV